MARQVNLPDLTFETQFYVVIFPVVWLLVLNCRLVSYSVVMIMLLTLKGCLQQEIDVCVCLPKNSSFIPNPPFTYIWCMYSIPCIY